MPMNIKGSLTIIGGSPPPVPTGLCSSFKLVSWWTSLNDVAITGNYDNIIIDYFNMLVSRDISYLLR